MSLLDALARRPDGTPRGVVLTWLEVARFLRDTVWNHDANKERKRKAAMRQAFYAGGGDEAMVEMLGQVFKDPDVIELRRQWIAHAKHNNVLRRAIHELATVYSQPAARIVADDANNARYATMQRATRMHEVMQRVNRLGYLHRAVFLYPRTRLNAAGKFEPVLELVTPDRFDVIVHPEDPTLLLGVSIDLALSSATALLRLPTRVVITATELIEVDSEGMFIESSLRPHEFGRIPGVLYCVDAPAGGMFDSRATDDLESAHRAVWFENILLLKESKSATKTLVLSGDVSATAQGQADDSERSAVLQDGTSATTIDRSMDLKMFRDTSRDIYETAAANHGIPPNVIAHGSIASADARELVRAPLRELRLAQQVPLRDVERELAEVQAAVYAPIPEVAFNTDGWSIDFADPQTPLGQKEALEVFEQERRLTLTSTIAEVMRRNPDLSREAAMATIEEWIDDELWRNQLIRPTQAISGSAGATVVPVAGATGPTPTPLDVAA